MVLIEVDCNYRKAKQVPLQNSNILFNNEIKQSFLYKRMKSLNNKIHIQVFDV